MYMSATTLRVGQETKARFDELKAVIEEKTDQTVSQDEFVSWLVSFAGDRRSDFLKEREGSWRPWTHEELDAFLDNLVDLGIETDASRIDEDLYGGER